MLRRQNCGGEYRLFRMVDDPSANKIWWISSWGRCVI